MIVLFCLLKAFSDVKAQTFLNGSFENTTATMACNYNLNNATFNGLMANTNAFGTGNETDILINGCYTAGIPDGVRAIGLAATYDEVSLELSAPLVAGNSYMISFWTYGEITFRPLGGIEIGVSMNNNTFGTPVGTAASVASTWMNHMFCFVAPNNGSYITVRNTQNGTIYWNHVDHFEFVSSNADFDFNDFCAGSPNGPSNIATPGGVFTFNPVPIDGATIDPATGVISNGVDGATYSVEYTLGGACPNSSVQTVTVSGFSYVSLIVDENCGAGDGEIDLTPVGGTPGYTYSIDNGVTSQGGSNFTGLNSGTYDIVITDATGCTATGIETIASSSGLTIDNVIATDETCAGTCDGEITISVSGGDPPYSYEWFDDTGNPIGPNAATIDNLCAGDYSVEVTDASGGSTIINTNYDFENGPGGGCDCPTGFTCANDAGQVFDGVMPVYVPGNQGCISSANNYTNSLGANSGTGYVYFYAGADNISTGSFPFVGGEQVELCVWYAGPQGAGASGQNTANAHFSFGVDGVQVGPDVTVPTNTGWTQFCFTVTMTPGNHTFQILSGGAAQYALWFDDFTVSNGTGGSGAACSISSNFVINTQVPGDPSFTLTDFCQGSPNSASNIVTPGGSFNFNPLPGDGSTINVVTGAISNGIGGTTYSVEYSTGGACPATSLETVTVIAQDDASFNLTDFCAGSTNSATGIVTAGGTFAFNPLPGDGATINSATGEITDGVTGTMYTVEYTTTGACSASSAETVTVTSQDNASFTLTDFCVGSANSATSIVTAGGSFAFNPAPGDGATINATTGEIINGVAGTTYNVEYITGGACSAASIQSVMVNGIPVIDDVIVSNETCLGTGDGSIEIVSVANGTGNYNYSWDIFPDPAISTAQNLVEGNYTVTVTDLVSGCQSSEMFDVTAPLAVTVDFNSTDVSCFGLSDGEIEVIGGGGTAGYNYSIDNGATWSANPIFSGLTAQTYQVVVEDANGCSSPVEDVTVGESNALFVNTVVTDVSCFNSCDGSITWNVVGGTAPYNYVSNGVNLGFNTAVDLCAGNYNYTITDANGCSSVGVEIVQSGVQVVPVIIARIDDGCTDDCDGEIVIGSNTGVSYTLNGVSSPTGIFTGLCAGSYNIVVTDANGCTADQDVMIGTIAPTYADFLSFPTTLTVYNNTVNFNNSSTNADQYEWNIVGENGYSHTYTTEDVEHTFPADTGTYQVCLTAINTGGCQDEMCVTIIVEDEIALYVPNSFTPDDDEFNQTFRAYVNGIDLFDFDFLIFNRWGELIWESHDAAIGWDGTYKGKLVQEGTYVWKIVVKDLQLDYRRTYTGHVSILK